MKQDHRVRPVTKRNSISLDVGSRVCYLCRVARRGRSDPMEGKQATRGMVRRMMRNNLAIVKSKPAEAPSRVVLRWADESGVTREDALELLERLRRSLPFEEDGCIRGSAILDAIELQAALVRDCDWVAANRLRLSADKLRDQFTRMGLL